MNVKVEKRENRLSQAGRLMRGAERGNALTSIPEGSPPGSGDGWCLGYASVRRMPMGKGEF